MCIMLIVEIIITLSYYKFPVAKIIIIIIMIIIIIIIIIIDLY